MRTRFPLSAKILSWFFLNLTLLALVGAIFGQQRMRFGLDSLVAGPAGDRLRAMTVLVLEEMAEAPRPQWDEILGRFGREHGVRLSLFSSRGPQIAGEHKDLVAVPRAGPLTEFAARRVAERQARDGERFRFAVQDRHE